MTVLAPTRLFDGQRLLTGLAVAIRDGRIAAILPVDRASPATRLQGTLAPAFVDLQVNGGGGLMVGRGTDGAALRHICATHQRLGCAGVLPTLITDTPDTTAQVIDAGIRAVGTPGFLGLHLEGPHLDPRRHGAHDPALVRPMRPEDLARLCDAARALPVLMVTLAPEAATPDQIATLSRAGVVVSLGHTDCNHDTARAAMAAGARCVTHLFNAMSQLGHRAPGLVGAVLAGNARAGLIADGIHVHPAAMRAALAARQDGIFLVTDCMGFAGTTLTAMSLNGRTIHRRDGRLTLDDGTLAGADLRMDEAIRILVGQVGIAPERALAMATAESARAVGLSDDYGALRQGGRADLVLLDDDLALQSVWIGGRPVTLG